MTTQENDAVKPLTDVLATPLTEIEKAELLYFANKECSLSVGMKIRRLCYQLDARTVPQGDLRERAVRIAEMNFDLLERRASEGNGLECLTKLLMSFAEETLHSSGLIGGASERERKLVEALTEITRGAGEFSRDPLQHATNCIEEMKNIAFSALATYAPAKPEVKEGGE